MNNVRILQVLGNLISLIEINSVIAEHVERLTPSLLAKAFRGELVRQDPNDESAEKLLERVKVGREASGKVDRPMIQKGKNNVAEKSKRT